MLLVTRKTGKAMMKAIEASLGTMGIAHCLPGRDRPLGGMVSPSLCRCQREAAETVGCSSGTVHFRQPASPRHQPGVSID
jgi:hypothetical protein